MAGGRVAFWGRDDAGRRGVYLWDGGTLSVLAEQGTELPGGRSLGFLRGFRLGLDRFAAIAPSSQGQLLYLRSLERGWEKVIDESCCGRVSEFAGRQLALSGVHVVRPDGSLLKVLQRGDVLDGQLVAAVFPGDLGGNELALVIRFDGSHADHLYVAGLPPLPVQIDVKPHRARNRLHARARGTVPVAILGSETFPVEQMDVATVEIGSAAAPARGRPKLRDVNRDGWTDLVLRFRPRETGLGRDDSEICLSGETHDGVAFEGCDAVTLRR